MDFIFPAIFLSAVIGFSLWGWMEAIRVVFRF